MKKVFISYSHVDDSFRKELESHLSTMKRNKEISSWSDRRITPSDEWKDCISKELNSAEIIVLLISSDFIASDYCFDIEVKAALDRHDKGLAFVIPVILRPCDWASCPFSKLQALPLDVKPVSKWSDRDDAWLSVIQGIRESLGKLSFVDTDSTDHMDFNFIGKINEKFMSKLNDTEIQLTHRRASKISLQDVFTWPDFRTQVEGVDKVSGSATSSILFKESCNYLIFGEEQSGKTALSRMMFMEYYRLGYCPILISGGSVNSVDIDKIIAAALKDHYEAGVKWGDVKDRSVLILDDFSSLNLNEKHKNEFVNRIKSYFKKCIILAESSFKFVVSEFVALDEFVYLDILGFGNVKRQEIIEKWVSLGVEEQISDEALCRESDDIKIRMNALVRSNILPPKPIYILAILQVSEAYTPQKVDLTSYGHCYQYLVYQALERANIKSAEIDRCINVMTELAWAQLNKVGRGFSAEELGGFFDEYDKKFLRANREKVINDLLNSKVLAFTDGITHFKYPYIYYFFAAKRLAETVGSDEVVKLKIRYLLENLHREEAGNIIVFITHHTKEKWILDEIQIALMVLFQDKLPATLSSSSLKFMEEFLSKIPKLVMEKREIQRERHLKNKNLDAAEAKELSLNKQVDKLEPGDTLAKINKAFKGLEIIGQIVRNRSASMGRDELLDLIEQAYSTGLRFLQFFIELSNVSKVETIKVIESALRENPSITNADVEREAKNLFLLLSYGVIYGVFNKIADSVGSREAEEIYAQLEGELDTPAVRLIGQSITLKFHKKLDFKVISGLVEEFSQNPTCERILKEIVIGHTYMFPVDYKDKQRISEILSLSVQGQRQMDMQKSFKA